MKHAFMTSFAISPAAPKAKTATAEARPRSAKMDQFLSKVNGSPRFNAVNAVARVSEAMAKSKKAM